MPSHTSTITSLKVTSVTEKLMDISVEIELPNASDTPLPLEPYRFEVQLESGQQLGHFTSTDTLSPGGGVVRGLLQCPTYIDAVKQATRVLFEAWLQTDPATLVMICDAGDDSAALDRVQACLSAVSFTVLVLPCDKKMFNGAYMKIDSLMSIARGKISCKVDVYNAFLIPAEILQISARTYYQGKLIGVIEERLSDGAFLTQVGQNVVSPTLTSRICLSLSALFALVAGLKGDMPVKIVSTHDLRAGDQQFQYSIEQDNVLVKFVHSLDGIQPV